MRQKEIKIRCNADAAHCHKGGIAPPLDKPLVAVFFHAVDEYSNVVFHGTKQTIGRGADCVAYEPYARKYLWVVSVSFSNQVKAKGKKKK